MTPQPQQKSTILKESPLGKDDLILSTISDTKYSV